MKTINLKNLAAAVSMFLLLSSAQAQSKSAVVIAPVKDAKAVNVYVEKKEPAPYNVSIIAEDNTEVWNEKYMNSMSKSFVLDKLPTGDYKIVVNNEEEYFEQNVSVVNDNVLVKGVSNTVFSPNMVVNGKNILVEYPNNASGQMAVRIADAKGNELYNSLLTKSAKRMIKYDMHKVGAGTYDLTFTIDGKSFHRSAEIRP